MVSVETALTMPVAVIILAALLASARYGIQQFHACQEAANQVRTALIAEPERPQNARTVTRPAGKFLGIELPPVSCTISSNKP
ncbi:hypothetical protein KRX54_01135 [Actinomycetaceae bacterium TAE3-ERU4]|nr:hypothetical protein [Actinomycetaceae bacterium TAE3-ERU4]